MRNVRQLTMLTALAVVAILVAGWMVLVRPQHSKANQINQQAQSVQQQNNVLANQVASLRQQAKNMPAEQALLASIATKIPNDPQLPALVRALTSAAQGAGVDLVSIAPSPPAAVSQPVAAPAAGAKASAPTLSQIALSLNVKGSYFTIEQFFANLEGMPRALRVTGFTLTGGAASTSGSSQQMTASISAQVYMAPGGTSTVPATTGTK